MAITVDNYTVYTPVEEIIQLLRAELYEKQNSILFNKIGRSGKNVMTNCPFHSGGQERKPSFGISDDGYCHCFACGWSSPRFGVFISELFGYQDNGHYGDRWLRGHISGISSEREPIKLNFGSRLQPKLKPPKTVILEDELEQYGFTHKYMYERKMTDDIINQFDIGYDKSRQCITFPIRDSEGDTIFVAARSVNSKFFILPEGQNKPVYGIYEAQYESDVTKPLIICESCFNCLTLWSWGYTAVALLGLGTKSQIDQLLQLPQRTFVICTDGDDPGRKAAIKLKNMIKSKKFTYIIDMKEGKDVNDLEKEEFEVLFSKKHF